MKSSDRPADPPSACSVLRALLAWTWHVATGVLELVGLRAPKRERTQPAMAVATGGPAARPTATDVPPPVPPPAEAPVEPPPAATAPVETSAADREPTSIPWGYGTDRVTAAAVDPYLLFTYWEATDEGIARARASLGPSGDGAWLCLRVHDTTGLLFDGRNAHHHFDHAIDRDQRQWFFDLHRPTATVFVELGLLAPDGSFARIARSGRVDFPRDAPAPWSEPEWMTVIASTGETRPEPPTRRPEARPDEQPTASASAPPDEPIVERAETFAPIPLWVIRDPGAHEAWLRELTDAGWERVEWREVQGEGGTELLGEIAWEGPRTVSTWETGPLTEPVEVRAPIREEWKGGILVRRTDGVTRIVHGPWQVVIRNLGAHVSRSVVSRWQIYRSWVAGAGREVRPDPGAIPAAAAPGASEALVTGASERTWLRASELRLGGASELWRAGASELRFGGASEQLRTGASERMVRGASERSFRGASEQHLAGGAVREAGARDDRPGGSEERLADGTKRSRGTYPDPGVR